jgi:DivIVA domain-containing protein
MTDESFHLTPLDIRRFDFGSALRGYDRARVDQFREQAANEVERLVKQAQALEAKAQGFHEQLRAFRERDKAINEALISAQQLRAEVREQAEREAQLILREARADAERIIASATNETRKIQTEIEGLVRQRRSYLSQLRTMMERHLSDVEAAEAGAASMSLESSPAPSTPPAASATAEPPGEASRSADVESGGSSRD